MELSIVDQVLKTEPVNWKELEILQSENFKVFLDGDPQRLIRSLKAKNFIDPFKVWEHKKKIYVIDGVHRILALRELEKEGTYKIPAKFTCNFIKCTDRKDAFEKMLVYSSQYTKVKRDGILDMVKVEGLDLPNISDALYFPNIDISTLPVDFQENISKQKIKDFYQLSYSFTEEERKQVQDAVKLSGKINHTTNANTALLHICKFFKEAFK